MRVERLHPSAVLPARAHSDDAGLDLCAAERGTILAGCTAAVRTGLAIELPAQVAGLVLPRSGLARRHQITVTNSPGLIDPGYRGEVEVLLTNLGVYDFEYLSGARIAQLLLVPFVIVDIEDATALSESERGAEGFGSTGV